jgi:hypothetical protein
MMAIAYILAIAGFAVCLALAALMVTITIRAIRNTWRGR